jgi:hypothetical protein
MRLSSLASFHALLLTGAAGLVLAVPLSCAVGSVESGIPGLGGSIGVGAGNGTTTGQGGQSTSTQVTNTSSTGGASTSSTSGSLTTSSTSGTFSTSSTSGTFSTSSSSSSSTSSSGASSVCDTGDCTDCGNCTQTGSGMCVNQLNDCLNDFGCQDILCCVSGCSDSSCVQLCESFDGPSSSAIFESLAECVDCSCQVSCQVPASDCP